MEIRDELLHKIYHIGCAANDHSLVEDCMIIMQGIVAARPDNTNAIVGLAGAQIVAKQYDDAIALLQTQLRGNVDNVSLKCLLGVAYTLSGDSRQGRALLQETVECGDESDRTLASTFLQNSF